MEAELFAIRCRINQAVQVTDISHIIVITNAIYWTVELPMYKND